jgi:hypothetical protein
VRRAVNVVAVGLVALLVLVAALAFADWVLFGQVRPF